MSTAIICPKRIMSPTYLRAVKAINPGRVLKVIGSNREISLAEYDKIISGVFRRP